MYIPKKNATKKSFEMNLFLNDQKTQRMSNKSIMKIFLLGTPIHEPHRPPAIDSEIVNSNKIDLFLFATKHTPLKIDRLTVIKELY